MKKLFTIIALLGITVMFAKAQGTLQFNQVLTLELQGATNVAFTVPTGKVWKIVSCTYSNYVYAPRISQINGKSTTMYLVNYVYGGNNIYPGVLPYWVAEGTDISFNHGSSTSQWAYVSVIEFNVIP